MKGFIQLDDANGIPFYLNINHIVLVRPIGGNLTEITTSLLHDEGSNRVFNYPGSVMNFWSFYMQSAK